MYFTSYSEYNIEYSQKAVELAIDYFKTEIVPFLEQFDNE